MRIMIGSAQMVPQLWAFPDTTSYSSGNVGGVLEDLGGHRDVSGCEREFPMTVGLGLLPTGGSGPATSIGGPRNYGHWGTEATSVVCETPNGDGVRPASLCVLLSRTSPEALQEDQQNRSLSKGMAEVWDPHCLTLAVSEEPIPHAEGGDCCQVTVASPSMSPGSDEQQVWLWMAWTQASQSMWPDQRHHRDNKELLNF